MLKNVIKLEHVIGNRVFHLFCDNDSPLNEVKDALFQFSKYIGQIEDAIKAQQDSAIQKEEASKPVEESKTE